MINQRI